LQENRHRSSNFQQIQLLDFRQFLLPIKRFWIFHGRLIPVNQGPQYLEGRYTLALPSPSRLAISVAPSPAVKALRAWLDAAGIEAGPLFRPINKAGTVAASRLTCRSVALRDPRRF